MTSLHLIKQEVLRAGLSPLTNGRISTYIRPSIAAVYLTRFCNSRCTFCDFWKYDRDPLELSSEQWGVIFSRLKAFGVAYVGVNASGEMFTRRDVFDILGHIRDLGMDFGVNTNGTLLGERKAKQLASLKPRVVTLGLDGVGNEHYLQTRGLKNGFDKVVGNIQHMQDAGITNIRVGSVLMKENMHDWVNLCQFALDKKLEGIRFTAYHDAYFNFDASPIISEYSQPGFLSLVKTEIDQLLELKRSTGIVKNSAEYLLKVPEFFKDQKSYFPAPCLQGSNRIELDAHGNVNLCSFVTKSLGNLVNQEMEDIWKSELHRQARDDAYHGKCPHCFLSCYSEENLRLSTAGFIPTLGESLKRSMRLLHQN